MDHMEVRIERGIKTGDLTRREAEGLRTELHEIKRREQRMREDGHLSDRERTKLHADLDRLDRHITREKRDDQRRRYAKKNGVGKPTPQGARQHISRACAKSRLASKIKELGDGNGLPTSRQGRGSSHSNDMPVEGRGKSLIG
jgi:hypothetical protein